MNIDERIIGGDETLFDPTALREFVESHTVSFVALSAAFQAIDKAFAELAHIPLDIEADNLNSVVAAIAVLRNQWKEQAEGR